MKFNLASGLQWPRDVCLGDRETTPVHWAKPQKLMAYRFQDEPQEAPRNPSAPWTAQVTQPKWGPRLAVGYAVATLGRLIAGRRTA